MNALAMEITRINKGLDRIAAQSQEIGETPLRIHEHGVDEGHGLGGPPFAPEFLAFLGECKHESHADEPDCWSLRRPRFRASNNRSHRYRLKRALRQLRTIAPAEFDVVNLIVNRGMTVEQARVRINEGRNARSQKSYSRQDFIILTVAGCSKLIESY